MVLALLLQGCFLDRTETAPADGSFDADAAARDARPGGDAEPLDAGARDARVRDAGSLDTGPADAGLTDAGPECTGPPTCDGETVRRCEAGVPAPINCTTEGAYCEAGACVAWVCQPSSVSCSPGTEATRCDERGTMSTTAACSRGCLPAVGCAPATACMLDLFGTIETSGTLEFDTCGQGDDATFVSGCTRVDISGPDVIVRLEVPVRAEYRIELDNVTSGVDPVLYLRAACDDAGSELACDDDGGPSVASEFDMELEPGDYFIVADSFRDTDEGLEGRCGSMRLTVALR